MSAAIRWSTQAAFTAAVTRDGMRMLTIVQLGPSGEQWFVVAIKGPEALDSLPEAIDLSTNELLGSFETVVEAMAIAEAHLTKWVRRLSVVK